ncbi:MAG: ferrous iron transport protein A [Candidatus Cloacimonetes bacterium]|nr:ferrous iron transport protein A [Candidatus Cloacimonadota bacterium]
MKQSLADLKPSETKVIKCIRDNSKHGKRLMELGFLPQTPVEMIRYSPFGDPIEFGIRGYMVALRKAEAFDVIVHDN